jgi:hypothetical protein
MAVAQRSARLGRFAFQWNNDRFSDLTLLFAAPGAACSTMPATTHADMNNGQLEMTAGNPNLDTCRLLQMT